MPLATLSPRLVVGVNTTQTTLLLLHSSFATTMSLPYERPAAATAANNKRYVDNTMRATMTTTKRTPPFWYAIINVDN